MIEIPKVLEILRDSLNSSIRGRDRWEILPVEINEVSEWCLVIREVRGGGSEPDVVTPILRSLPTGAKVSIRGEDAVEIGDSKIYAAPALQSILEVLQVSESESMSRIGVVLDLESLEVPFPVILADIARAYIENRETDDTNRDMLLLLIAMMGELKSDYKIVMVEDPDGRKLN